MDVQISDGDTALRNAMILEDEGLVSMMMEDILRDLGCDEVDAFPDVSSALKALETRRYDCAILDVRLRDGHCGEVADTLARKGIPFLFSTGSGLDGLAEQHRNRPVIQKPFADDDLRMVVLDTVAAARLGAVRVASPVASD